MSHGNPDCTKCFGSGVTTGITYGDVYQCGCVPATARPDDNALRARVERAKGLIEDVLHQVALAQKAQAQRGGQHAGIPRFIQAPPSVLSYLERELGWALNALEGKDPQ